MPAKLPPFVLSVLDSGGTVVAERNGKRRTSRALDVQARYGVWLRNPGVDGAPELLPIVGGGEARARFDELTASLDVRDVTSFLAYHVAPVGVEQALLTPVYVFGGTVMVDDSWVDAADFVFYTGHANRDGWVLSAPDDGALTSVEIGANPAVPGDLWGQQDLEWIIIAACGPLQDDLLSAGGGDVLGRWDGAFDGLHSLMGYGAITFDTTDEGRRVVHYAREGTPLIDAWLRTGQEIQPASNGEAAPDGPTVWVGAMWVSKPGADPRLDHLWGHGAVSADPTAPTGLACMWTTC
jgi:hypothetical protein